MTSCVQFEKTEGQLFGADILEGGWMKVLSVREFKKERNGEI